MSWHRLLICLDPIKHSNKLFLHLLLSFLCPGFFFLNQGIYYFEMPINLLKHKSYHVYNARNIERVRRDEAASAERAEANRVAAKQAKLAALRDSTKRRNSHAAKKTQSVNDSNSEVNELGFFELEELKHIHEKGAGRTKDFNQKVAAENNYDSINGESEMNFGPDYGQSGSVMELLLGRQSISVNQENKNKNSKSHGNFKDIVTSGSQRQGFLPHSQQGCTSDSRSKVALDPLAEMLRGVAATEKYERERSKSRKKISHSDRTYNGRNHQHKSSNDIEDKRSDLDVYKVHKTHHSRHSHRTSSSHSRRSKTSSSSKSHRDIDSSKSCKFKQLL